MHAQRRNTDNVIVYGSVESDDRRSSGCIQSWSTMIVAGNAPYSTVATHNTVSTSSSHSVTVRHSAAVVLYYHCYIKFIITYFGNCRPIFTILSPTDAYSISPAECCYTSSWNSTTYECLINLDSLRNKTVTMLQFLWYSSQYTSFILFIVSPPARPHQRTSCHFCRLHTSPSLTHSASHPYTLQALSLSLSLSLSSPLPLFSLVTLN